MTSRIASRSSIGRVIDGGIDILDGYRNKVARGISVARSSFGDHWQIWLLVVVCGAIIHGGTAILRADSFWPYPKSLDFSSYYAGAWALRLGLSPYNWSPGFITTLRESQSIPFRPPAHNSSPLWAAAMLPWTLLDFPSAAWLWLLVQLILVAWSHGLLVREAGHRIWPVAMLALPISLTFGPLFLNVTLGQNGPLLLLSSLLLGQAMRQTARGCRLWVLSSWVLAVGAKVYPVLWMGAFFTRRAWRSLLVAALLLLGAFGLVACVFPDIHAEYWFEYLPAKTVTFSHRGDPDDQSVIGFLSRIGRPGSYTVQGLSLGTRNTVVWQLPWQLPAPVIMGVAAVVLFTLGCVALLPWFTDRAGMAEPAGALYAFVLFSLLIFPHMSRYNHILVLPSMAWLWGAGQSGRRVTAIAYFMFGLSRLNHLWVVLVPGFAGAVASGVGLFAVVLLLLASARKIGVRRLHSAAVVS